MRALELFLKVATPTAANVVDDFLSARLGGTLDDFLLTNLRRPVKPGEDPGAFVREWQEFASGAKAKARNKDAERAWAQWRAFGGDNGRALPLHALPPGEDVANGVVESGVVRINACLSTATAQRLRAFVLATRDESVARAAEDKEAGAECLSRVLSPRDVDSELETRWDVRLPWSAEVREAVYEMMGEHDSHSSLGHALSVLSGGNSAELFECAAIVSTVGSAPQIVHADTVPTEAGAVLHTVFVALQDISEHQGPTRFLPRTHTCTRSHDELDQDTPDAAFCERAESVIALLRAGDCTLYDSRTLHSGGPHRSAPVQQPISMPESPHEPHQSPNPSLPVERVLFYLSFKHALASDAELTNGDAHGAGSILPSLAALRTPLGSLRSRGL